MTLDPNSLDTLRRIKLADTYWASGKYRCYLEAFKEAMTVVSKPNLVLVKNPAPPIEL